MPNFAQDKEFADRLRENTYEVYAEMFQNSVVLRRAFDTALIIMRDARIPAQAEANMDKAVMCLLVRALEDKLRNCIEVGTPNGDWCHLFWDEATGEVICNSSYGCWSHWWTARGEGVSVPKFLLDCNSEYLGNKFMGGDFQVFDLEATVAEIRKSLAELRENKYIDKHRGEKEKVLTRRLADGEMDFKEWCDSTRAFAEPWELSTDGVNPTWTNFKNRLWDPLIVPQLQGRVQSE